ncbi:DNA-binding protein [Salinisphaera japonica YTM-1]|uniref:DNA-binding protein n=2 Tax=Salinisphaera TaxID=180541 RepID=A0A423PZW3_9GAMM|nr:sugar-binding transcriptional regulator [Salinisphaera japonica]ROO31163.1 DNA-binding protein [Salinisphaera japonica YTM-1]
MNTSISRELPMTADELTELAKLYHIDGWTQEALAQRFDVSRVKIGRLLKRAVSEGIVEICVRLSHPPDRTAALEQALIARFGIKRAIISVDHRDAERQRELLAGLVARYLDQRLGDTSVVAVGMGRNVSAVPRQVVARQHRHCTFVCAIGGSYRGGEAMNADQTCRRFAERFGGESVTLYAPAIVANRDTRDALMANDTVRQSLTRAQQADMALVGVGDILEDSNMVRMGWFTQEEINAVRRLGVVGDIMGYDFIDMDGALADTPLVGRVIGLTIEHLRHIPDVIATASEPTKVGGILGALRTGTIDTLATTESIAETVLGLDQSRRAGGD